MFKGIEEFVEIIPHTKGQRMHKIAVRLMFPPRRRNHDIFFFERTTQDSASFIDIAEKIQVYSPGRP